MHNKVRKPCKWLFSDRRLLFFVADVVHNNISLPKKVLPYIFPYFGGDVGGHGLRGTHGSIVCCRKCRTKRHVEEGRKRENKLRKRRRERIVLIELTLWFSIAFLTPNYSF